MEAMSYSGIFEFSEGVKDVGDLVSCDLCGQNNGQVLQVREVSNAFHWDLCWDQCCSTDS